MKDKCGTHGPGGHHVHHHSSPKGPFFKIDAILNVDERGQTVLPKSLREQMGIEAGDKLAAVTWDTCGPGNCIALIKVDDMSDMLRDMFGPLIDEIAGSQKGTKKKEEPEGK